MNKCKDCRYWEGYNHQCHRYPRQTTTELDYWPAANPDDWCGEFKEKEEGK